MAQNAESILNKSNAQVEDKKQFKAKRNGFKGMEISEIIFKVFAYFFIAVFALICLYPFVYAISGALSGYSALYSGAVVVFPVDLQIDAFKVVFTDNGFWSAYSNTIVLTLFGTLYSMILSILGGYALSKKNLFGHKFFNFFLVFTMWFTAGMIPTYLNYIDTRTIFRDIGITDDKWFVVVAMGIAAYNIILLRNAFEAVPSEIDEAARVDGANEFQIMAKVYVPMSKATIATVALFYGISRWNGYFWAKQTLDVTDAPLQVYIRNRVDQFSDPSYMDGWHEVYAPDSLMYGMIVCAIIPIVLIYPFIQKYFAAGVNIGGVKE